MIPPLLASTAPIGAPEMSPLVGVTLALFFVFLNGFFVAAEFALVKVRGTQLDPLVAEGNRKAKVARHMVTHLDAYLSATQLGITLASLALGWIGESAFPHHGRECRDQPPFERYLNSPADTASDALLTEICIPLN